MAGIRGTQIAPSTHIKSNEGSTPSSAATVRKPGSIIFVPRRTPHAFLVTSDRFRGLVLFTPGSEACENWFRTAGDPAPAYELPEPGRELLALDDVARLPQRLSALPPMAGAPARRKIVGYGKEGEHEQVHARDRRARDSARARGVRRWIIDEQPDHHTDEDERGERNDDPGCNAEPEPGRLRDEGHSAGRLRSMGAELGDAAPRIAGQRPSHALHHLHG